MLHTQAAAVFPKTCEVQLIDVEKPRIERPTEVKVRMPEVGICGADKEIRSLTILLATEARGLVGHS